MTNFKPVCDAHDICYSTCNSSRDVCDRTFCLTMRQTCLHDYPKNPGLLALCLDVATAYCAIVVAAGAQPFASAQDEGCICCQAWRREM